MTGKEKREHEKEKRPSGPDKFEVCDMYTSEECGNPSHVHVGTVGWQQSMTKKYMGYIEHKDMKGKQSQNAPVKNSSSSQDPNWIPGTSQAIKEKYAIQNDDDVDDNTAAIIDLFGKGKPDIKAIEKEQHQVFRKPEGLLAFAMGLDDDSKHPLSHSSVSLSDYQDKLSIASNGSVHTVAVEEEELVTDTRRIYIQHREAIRLADLIRPILSGLADAIDNMGDFFVNGGNMTDLDEVRFDNYIRQETFLDSDNRQVIPYSAIREAGYNGFIDREIFTDLATHVLAHKEAVGLKIFTTKGVVNKTAFGRLERIATMFGQTTRMKATLTMYTFTIMYCMSELAIVQSLSRLSGVNEAKETVNFSKGDRLGTALPTSAPFALA